MSEKFIRCGSNFNHQMAPCTTIFQASLYNFKSQNGKICSFLASNGKNVMAYDENSWFFDVPPFKQLKFTILLKSLNFTKEAYY